MPDLYTAFWNVENLFDVENSPRRTEKLQRTIGGELAGWTQPVLDRKVEQLARVIGQLNGGMGPDLPGVCEIENRHVLELLSGALAAPGRNYAIAHDDSDDGRGIDVAFIYDADVLTLQQQFSHVIVKREATREILQVDFQVGAKLLVVIGNHWPSKSGGDLESEGFRIVAGETMAYFHERVREINGKDVAVLAMGDFNDEPYRRSLVQYALSENDRLKVENARTPRLWNLMWPLLGRAVFSYYYGNEGSIIDQLLVSQGIATGSSGIMVRPETTAVHQLPEMRKAGEYPAPRRYGRPSERLDQDGFSDHYPVSVVLGV
jgi:hypothetical protein